jgi:hypothetical protein
MLSFNLQDDGDSWSMERLDHNPARLGGPLGATGAFSMQHKSSGCEVYGAPTRDGGWLAFVRPCCACFSSTAFSEIWLPFSSSFMSPSSLPFVDLLIDCRAVSTRVDADGPTDWFTRAKPGGAAWPPLGRAPYPMTASSMITTASGYIIQAGQFPIVSLQVSWDDGFSWRFFDIDYNGACGGNGALAEVAPDVVWYGYSDGYEWPPVYRYQIFRVTTSGDVVPLDP